MAAPASIDELLKLMRKSGMLDEARLDAYLQKLQETDSTPREPRKMAAMMVRDALLTNFQAEQFLLGKWRGFTIGKYKLLERIGFGGMGQVFLCEHTAMRRRVAIKVLPPAKAEDPAALGRFYREARAAGTLSHPNIVRTHDIDQDGNLHFLVMEYVDGTSLLDVVKKLGPMDVERCCHYIRQAAAGLEHAYQSGIIHRDIKPGNILVDRGGLSKILDMGLARFYDDDQDMLTLKYDEKSVLGTADYVAPEQTINSHDVDIRADIYGLGATFYFILAGHPPFPEGTIAQKLLWHQTKVPRSIREVRPEVPAGVERVLVQMLAKRAEERFQTPAEVWDALEPYCRNPIPAPPTEEMPKLSPAAMEPVPGSAPAAARAGKAASMASIQLPDMSPGQSGVIPPRLQPAAGGSSAPVSSSSSGMIKNPFFEPPPSQPLFPPASSTSLPAMPRGGRPAAGGSGVVDTRNLLGPSDPTPVAENRPAQVPAFAAQELPDAAAGPTARRKGCLGVLVAGISLVGGAGGVVAWLLA